MNKGYQNFKKRAGQLAIALTLAGTTAIGANAATVTGVTKANVNMRSGAGTKYKVVSVVKADKTVTILGQKGSWYKVKYNGKTGYISKSYVIKKNYTVKKYSGKYKTKVALTVRKGPGTNYVKAGTLKKGTVVTVKGKTSNGWLQISYKGATRYISGSSKYVAKYTAPVKNNAPVIDVEDTYTLTKGEDFEYAMLNATATDKEDGDIALTDDNFSGQVNVNKVGEYSVKITVTDKGGKTATKTVKVVVENVKTNNKPSIAVDSTYQVKENGKFDFSMLGAKAFDNEDGDLTSKIQYSGTVDVKKVGKYTVTLTVTDSKGNTTKKEVVVSVVRNYRPVIKTPYEEKGYKVESRKDFDLSDLKVTTTDIETPNNVKVTYTIKDDAGKVLDKISTDQIRTYTVTINAVDGDGVEAYPVKVKVSVVPNEDPRLNFKYDDKFIESKSNVIKVDKATDTLTVEEKENVTIADLKAIFNAVADDGYDSVAGEHDITSSIEIIPTQAKINDMLNKAGEYTIKFQISDNGKSAFKSVKLVVKANNEPEISFKNDRVVDAHHDKYDKAYKIKLNQKFDIAELNAYVKDINAATGKENQGTTLESNIDNNVVLTNQQGTTVLTFRATDNKGATKTVKVGVIVEDYKDNMNAPQISYENGTKVVNDVLEIQCEEGLKLNANQIQNLVKAVATDKEDGAVSVSYRLFDTNKFNPDKPLDSIDAGVLNHKYTFRITATDNGDSNGENQKTTVKDVTIIIVNK